MSVVASNSAIVINKLSGLARLQRPAYRAATLDGVRALVPDDDADAGRVMSQTLGGGGVAEAACASRNCPRWITPLPGHRQWRRFDAREYGHLYAVPESWFLAGSKAVIPVAESI